MKIMLAVISIALIPSLIYAQNLSIEKDFANKRPKLLLEKYSEGEDATSGFDYLIYKDKSQIVKIRSIWTSSANPTARIDDYYFENGKLVLYVKLTFPEKRRKDVIKEKTLALTTKEKLYLKDSKLTTWIENGKTIPATDSRWKDKEKEVLEQAKGELDNYQFLKEERN